MLHIHKDSHLDHGIKDVHLDFFKREVTKPGVTTFENLPLPPLDCALYGPEMGDDPVAEDEVTYEVRGEREGYSRMIDKPVRPCCTITVICGPHDGHDLVLFTCYGGPAAPREPFDPSHDKDTLLESTKFWATHALAKGN